MRWHNNLYVRSIKSVERVKWKIEHKAGLVEVYVITLSRRKGSLLEIYPSYTLMQSHIRSQDLYIVGLARGYRNALELVRSIIEEVYNETGSLRVDLFFKEGA
ncbi:MAG: hypothetical protein II169_04390 [Lachnospiraceae bacterium]|nr:hypothetical protein [Lachnospiraceae bacterium]